MRSKSRKIESCSRAWLIGTELGVKVDNMARNNSSCVCVRARMGRHRGEENVVPSSNVDERASTPRCHLPPLYTHTHRNTLEA